MPSRGRGRGRSRGRGQGGGAQEAARKAERRRQAELKKKQRLAALKKQQEAERKRQELIRQRQAVALKEKQRQAAALKKQRQAAALKEKQRQAAALKEKQRLAALKKRLAALKEKQRLAALKKQNRKPRPGRIDKTPRKALSRADKNRLLDERRRLRQNRTKKIPSKDRGAAKAKMERVRNARRLRRDTITRVMARKKGNSKYKAKIVRLRSRRRGKRKSRRQKRNARRDRVRKRGQKPTRARQGVEVVLRRGRKRGIILKWNKVRRAYAVRCGAKTCLVPALQLRLASSKIGRPLRRQKGVKLARIHPVIPSCATIYVTPKVGAMRGQLATLVKYSPIQGVWSVRFRGRAKRRGLGKAKGFRPNQLVVSGPMPHPSRLTEDVEDDKDGLDEDNLEDEMNEEEEELMEDELDEEADDIEYMLDDDDDALQDEAFDDDLELENDGYDDEDEEELFDGGDDGGFQYDDADFDDEEEVFDDLDMDELADAEENYDEELLDQDLPDDDDWDTTEVNYLDMDDLTFSSNKTAKAGRDLLGLALSDPDADPSFGTVELVVKQLYKSNSQYTFTIENTSDRVWSSARVKLKCAGEVKEFRFNGNKTGTEEVNESIGECYVTCGYKMQPGQSRSTSCKITPAQPSIPAATIVKAVYC